MPCQLVLPYIPEDGVAWVELAVRRQWNADAPLVRRNTGLRHTTDIVLRRRHGPPHGGAQDVTNSNGSCTRACSGGGGPRIL